MFFDSANTSSKKRFAPLLKNCIYISVIFFSYFRKLKVKFACDKYAAVFSL